jgi:hypothetical protein
MDVTRLNEANLLRGECGHRLAPGHLDRMRTHYKALGWVLPYLVGRSAYRVLQVRPRLVFPTIDLQGCFPARAVGSLCMYGEAALPPASAWAGIGHGALTFGAWFEAQFGAAAWTSTKTCFRMLQRQSFTQVCCVSVIDDGILSQL